MRERRRLFQAFRLRRAEKGFSDEERRELGLSRLGRFCDGNNSRRMRDSLLRLRFSGNRVIYAGRSGKGAILSDEPARWILNVTERRYSVPFWAEGGIMYHIFVDRFCSVGDIPEREGAVIRRDWGNMPEYRPDPASGKILNNDFSAGI